MYLGVGVGWEFEKIWIKIKNIRTGSYKKESVCPCANPERWVSRWSVPSLKPQTHTRNIRNKNKNNPMTLWLVDDNITVASQSWWINICYFLNFCFYLYCSFKKIDIHIIHSATWCQLETTNKLSVIKF